ncbi:uncharacterized protein LOC126778406 [Nymphalis io]|uniref:uncharacterized protein LOC126778406 n=1 Tax=Inachis io TaxID=171585 RepID=UPI002168C041|nr:uncharacterized protein LOC126778406 [Nymphalis io]
MLILTVNADKTQPRATLKWWLRSGSGAAVYVAGVRDCGALRGLRADALRASLRALRDMARALGAALQPQTKKYDTLKSRLLAVYEESENRQLQKLLSEIDLGDEKPSQLLRRMRDLARRKIPDETLSIMWQCHLPAAVRSVLAVTDVKDLENLATIADKIMENTRPIQIAESYIDLMTAYNIYVVMLCRGENGYAINISQVDPIGGTPLRKTVSCMNYYCYRIMTRRNNFNTLLRYGMLTNQYLVDQYAKIESQRLAYIRNNQTKLRAENYVHLQDALQANEHRNGIGQLVILPSSFTGGPRYLHEKSQDAMTYVRNYGKPDLFITATCNPNWPEIKENINTNLTPQDRYDIVNRVFHLKVQKLLHLINKSHIFGPPRCHMYTIEWQKRGLPHVHLLVWLVNKIRPNQIDRVISAELPDKDEDPILYEIVKKHMINEVLENMSSITSSITFMEKEFEEVKQEMNSKTQIIKSLENENKLLRSDISNLHSRLALLEQQSRAYNLEIQCIPEFSDQATFSIQSPNEVEKYQSGRYICSSEAVLSFEVHDRAPTIVHLAVHLENGQRVYFTENNIQEVVNNPRDITLTAFFKLCAQDDFAKTLTYDRVPGYYTWNQSSKTFQRRKQGTAVDGFPGK